MRDPRRRPRLRRRPAAGDDPLRRRDASPNSAKDAPPQTMLGADAEGLVPRPAAQLDARPGRSGATRSARSTGAPIRRTCRAGIAQALARRRLRLLRRRRRLATRTRARARSTTPCATRGITGFAIVSGDRHSFWAGLAAKALPPAAVRAGRRRASSPARSRAPGWSRRYEHRLPQGPSAARALHGRPAGRRSRSRRSTCCSATACARASSMPATGDLRRRARCRNPDLAPHLRFVDMGGHGYATVRVDGRRDAHRVRLHPAPARAQRRRRTAGRCAIASSTASGAGRRANGRGSSSKSSKGRRHWRRRQSEAADPAIRRLFIAHIRILRPRPAMICERLPSITNAASGLAKSRSL